MQHPHDLKFVVAHPEQDHMLAIGRDLAVAEQIVPESEF